MSDAPARMRIDKWLWAARFYKTRSLAAQAVENGHARVGDDRVKPAHAVRAGDRVVIRRQGLAWDVEVLALSERRGGAADAALLYRETAESAAVRERAIAERRAVQAGQGRTPGRPTKRDRRRLLDFLDEP